MSWLLPTITACLTGSLVLFFFFFYLYRAYREKAFLLMALAWLINSFKFIFELTGITDPSDLQIILANITSITSGILLLHGTSCLMGKPISRAWTAIAATGILWLIVAKASGAQFLFMTVPACAVLSAIYIFTGFKIIRAMGSAKASALATVLSFILLGIFTVCSPFLLNFSWFMPWKFTLSTILESASAIGILIISFEIFEKKLKKAGQTYLSIFNSTSEAIFIHDADTGKILDVNDTATMMFGYDREEFLSFDSKNQPDAIMQFTNQDGWLKLFHALKEGPQTFERLCRNKSGNSFWTEVSLKEFSSGEKQAVVAVVRDISERKTADQAFEHSKSSLRQLFEEGLLIFIMLDENGKITFSNSNFARMTGWRSDEISGCDWFKNFLPDQEDAKEYFIDTITSKGSCNASVRYSKIRIRSGKDRLLRWNCAPIYDSGTKCDGAVIIGEDITEHRMAEEEKEFRNALLTTEMETTIDGILIVDSESKIIMSNKRFSEIWGIPEGIMNSASDEEALGHVINKLKAPEKFIERVKYLYEHPDEKSRDEIELNDGRILDRYSASMFGSTGKYYGRAWYFRDITEQKQTENILREREEQLSGLAENLPGVIFQFYARQDGSMGIYYISDRANEIFGIDDDDIKASFKIFLECVHNDHREAFISSIEEAVKNKSKWDFEGKFIRPDGLILWFKGISIPVERNGELVFNGLFLDITEKKMTEDALIENEEKFRALFNNMTEGVALHEIIFNENGVAEDYRIIDANPAYSKHVGINYNEVIGKTGRVIYNTHEPPFLIEFETVAKTRVPYTFEAFFKPLNKNFSISVVSPKAGQFATVFEDITNRKKAEADRLEIERKMLHVQKLESLGILAGGIAHDFNNILTSILGNADIALIKLPPASPARDSLAEIERSAQRASDLCRQMLAYSGKGKFIIENINLDEIIRNMAQLFKASISKKASLTINSAKNLPSIKGDATQIRQILMNLVTNASDAIEEKSGTVIINTGSLYCSGDFLIEISLGEKLPEGLYVFLEVSDSGCGMSPETVSRIFEPFFTTKFTGRGLGMAAVLGIVKGHNGGIEIKSEPEKGSIFRIFFPVSETDTEKKVSENSVLFKKHKGEFALVVDDEETIRTVATEMLKMLGLDAITATDGFEAIKTFEEFHDRIDLVLLDLTMPGLSGEETLQELKKIRPDIKVLISSGYSGEEISEKLYESGISGFIQKPFNVKALSEKINEIMQAP